MHAADAVYHASCFSNFTKVNIGRPVGRPVNKEAADVFDVICNLLGSSNSGCELYSVDELVERMNDLFGDPEIAYSVKYMKAQLLKRFGKGMKFSDVSGKKDVICFQNVAKRLINDKWYSDRESSVEKESQRIIDTAAQLIKAEIRKAEFPLGVYPTDFFIRSQENVKGWVPPLLLSFLQQLIVDELKQISMGHAIVHASRPRSVISPVLFGVGVAVDHLAAKGRSANACKTWTFSFKRRSR